MHVRTALWILAILFWVIGDLATTYYGLQHGLVESNHIANHILQNGFGKLIAYKVFATCVAYLCYMYIRSIDYTASIGIPIGLNIVGIAVFYWNTYLIFAF